MRLPTKENTVGSWDRLISWGIKLNEPLDKDNLFVETTLPEGWAVETDGGYWSYLTDNRGLARANIFTKLAFWDTDTFISVIHNRFVISNLCYETTDKTIIFHYVIRDLGLKRTVQLYEPAYYAYLTKDSSKLGAIIGDTFYFNARKERFKSSSKFTSQTSSSNATKITSNIFYKNYHHVGKGEYYFLDAVAKLGKDNISSSLLELEDAAWAEQYDFPDINPYK